MVKSLVAAKATPIIAASMTEKAVTERRKKILLLSLDVRWVIGESAYESADCNTRHQLKTLVNLLIDAVWMSSRCPATASRTRSEAKQSDRVHFECQNKQN